MLLEEKDPERLLKLKECCDLLLAGGYFRARIPQLSPFDKVVGGLAWSITASGTDVDVDVIFQENASIGQKMSVAAAARHAMHASHHSAAACSPVHASPSRRSLSRMLCDEAVRRLTKS